MLFGLLFTGFLVLGTCTLFGLLFNGSSFQVHVLFWFTV